MGGKRLIFGEYPRNIFYVFYKISKERFFFKIKQLFYRMKLLNGKHTSSSKKTQLIYRIKRRYCSES